MGEIIQRRHAACSTTSAAYELRIHFHEKDVALGACNEEMTLSRYSSPNALRWLMSTHAMCHWRPVTRFTYCTGRTQIERSRSLMQPIGEIAVIQSPYQCVPRNYRRNRRVVLRERHRKSECSWESLGIFGHVRNSQTKGCLNCVCI